MKDLAIILGIRPDVIRASKILNLLAESSEITYDFIWSGQHYSDNMKDVFFSQLNVPKPDFEFEIDTTNDSTIVSSIIKNTYEHLDKNKYKAAIFLGDTNTVMGCIGVIQHNIPVVHIEGCMRSYDWRMPEEKYRTTIDHLSDRIYAYLDSYKKQGLNEGISENVINVTGNPIVDIINDNQKLFDTGGEHLDDKILNFIKNDNFTLATSHRRENILDQKSLTNIVNLLNQSESKIVFPMGYKTQEMLKEFNLDLKSNVLVTDPIGYLEFMYLMKNSHYVISDSGTVVEDCLLYTSPSPRD